jgi:hypothetical protein
VQFGVPDGQLLEHRRDGVGTIGNFPEEANFAAASDLGNGDRNRRLVDIKPDISSCA